MTETVMTAEAALKLAQTHARSGRFDEADRILGVLCDHVPTNAGLRFERGRVAQRAGRMPQAIEHYRSACRIDPGNLAAREALGAALQRSSPQVRPATPARLDEDDTDAFVYVVSSSHARSFGYSSRFLPFMLGSGAYMTFVTEAHAQRTRMRVLAHLDRLDLRFPVIFALGNSDPITHAANFEKTKDMQRAGLLGSDEEILTAAADRHGALIAEIVRRYPGVRLTVLNGYPMLDPEQNGFLPLTSGIVRRWCERLGVYFCDANDGLRDLSTGLIRQDRMCAPGDDHLSKAATRVIEEMLLLDGALRGRAPDFDWTYLMRFNLGPDIESRVWTEPHLGPENMQHSQMIRFNRLLERALTFICADLSLSGGTDKLLIVNGREGWAAFSLPVGLAASVVTVDPSPEHVRMGRRLAHFLRRSEIDFQCADMKTLWERTAEPAYDDVLAMVDADGPPEAQAELLAALQSSARRRLFVLSRNAWAPEAPAQAAGGSSVEIIPLGDQRDGREDGGNLLILRRPEGADRP